MISLSHDVATAVAGVILSTTTVFLIGVVAVRLLNQRPAAVRHLIWAFALAGSAAIIVGRVVAPGVMMDLVLPAAVARPPENHTPSVTGDARSERAPSAPQLVESRVPVNENDAASAIAKDSVLVAIWLAGLTLMGLYRTAGHLRVARVVRRAERAQDSPWQSDLAELCRRVGLRRIPTLRFTSELPGPAVAGIIHPVILLPVSAMHWPATERRPVLLHEIAHIARRDAFHQLIGDAALALQWFHPGAWYALRRLLAESERSCDDWAIDAGMDSTQYATVLLAVARRAMGPVARAPLMSLARPAHLETRVRAILDPTTPHWRPTRPTLLGATAIAVALLAPLITVHPRISYASSTVPTPRAVSDSTYERSIATNAGELLSVALVTRGTVAIAGWSDPRVSLRARFGGVASADAIGFARMPSGVGLTLQTNDHSTASQLYALDLRVPNRMSIALQSANGSVSVTGVPLGEKAIRVQSGDISVGEALNGGDFITGNGNIDVARSRGDIAASVSNGHIVLGDVRGNVDAHVARGDARVELTGPSAARRISVTVSSGSVTLIVPRSFSAVFDLETVSESSSSAPSIDSDVPLADTTAATLDSVHGRRHHVRRATGVIGNGSAQIRIRTNAGSIVIRQSSN